MFSEQLVAFLFIFTLIYFIGISTKDINWAKKIRCYLFTQHMSPTSFIYYKGRPMGNCPCCGRKTVLDESGWRDFK